MREFARGKRIAKVKKSQGSKLKGGAYAAITQHGDDSSTNEGLEVPKEGREGEVQLQFKTFRAKDMPIPSFKVGMVFDLVKTLSAPLTGYSLKNRVDINLPRNDKMRVRAHCAQGCPWN